MVETLEYDNYRFIKDAPDKYNNYYLYGIGMIDSEFKIDKYVSDIELEGSVIRNDYYLAKCIEIMLCEVPKDQFLKNKGEI